MACVVVEESRPAVEPSQPEVWAAIGIAVTFVAATRWPMARPGPVESDGHLGWVDAPVRYSVKLALALLGTFGPGLAFLPRGLARLGARPEGRSLAALLALPMAPALGSHLLVHFGVAGYSFHYLPAAVALLAVGIGRASGPVVRWDRAPARLSALAAGLAAVFLLYPADFDRPGLRGDFDLAVARYTRVGLHAEVADRAPGVWRTGNSVSNSRVAGGRLQAN